ncbi:carboxypeptidase-like regulatory domain-containing protein [Archangium violaceum]|uniref:carboxypeptidase-like regulatory domain-containing protein n=1 Tax=Archangium violaceum TaxID=83451 RepID=UPI001EF5D6BC|nr:carboxypeptidase-like regulatory domain-containing protein [Archangium violaceum]
MMKMMRRSALLLLPALLGLGCGESGRVPDAPEELQVESSALSAVFSGTVLDSNRRPVPNARVTVNGIVLFTNSAGAYSVSVEGATAGYRIDIRKDGYGPVNQFKISGELNQVHVLGRAYIRQINPAVSNQIVDTVSGIRVEVLPNSLGTATGTPAKGTVVFSIAPHDPATMPGDFTARNSLGQTVALESVGAVTLSAVDSLGNTLTLLPGATMNVSLPVPASVGGTMPACVLNATCRTAMWRFTPSTGLWNEQSANAQFNTQGTSFRITGIRNSTIDPADGLGTWNADIEHTSPSCSIIEFVNIPLDCYNPPPGTTPEPGIELAFQQQLTSGAPWSKSAGVRSSASFIVLYNLRGNTPLDLSAEFPAGAPAYCAGNLSITSTPAPSAGFPVYWATGGATRYNTGAPAPTAGYPKDSSGNPIDFADVATGNHPCSSHIYLQTHP